MTWEFFTDDELVPFAFGTKTRLRDGQCILQRGRANIQNPIDLWQRVLGLGAFKRRDQVIAGV